MDKKLKIKKKNMEKLGVGYTFKNYKDMTEQLGIKNKGGDSRVAQMEKIKKEYFDFKKEGHKIIITSINKKYKNLNIEKNNKNEKGCYSIDIKQVEKLSKGHVFKNYKDMISFLNAKYPSGNSKQKQSQFIENHIFKSHKEGNKIVVDDVYDIEKIKDDLYLKSNGFSGLLSKLLLHVVAKHFTTQMTKETEKDSDKNIYFDINHNIFIRELGLVNSNYEKLFWSVKECSKEMDIPLTNSMDFFNRMRGFLHYNFHKTIRKTEEELEVSFTNIQYGKFMKKESNHFQEFLQELSPEMLKNIKIIEKNVLRKMGYSTKEEMQKKGDNFEFERIKREDLKDILGIHYYYNIYRVVPYDNSREEKLNWDKYILSQEEEERIRNIINSFSKSNILENAKKRIEKKKNDSQYEKTLEESFDRVLADFKEMTEIFIEKDSTFKFLNFQKREESSVNE